MFNGQKKSSFRFTTLIVVVSVHVGVIFIPLGMMLLMPAKPKPIAFRVKLGGAEPSHAPELGPPERIRPTGTSGGGAPPPPKEPLPPPPPAKKVIPKPPAEKPVVKPKAKPKPKPKAKPKAKPKPKVKPKAKPKPNPKAKPKAKPKPKVKSKAKPKVDRKKFEQERLKKLQQQEVHHDNRFDNWDPTKPFGVNNHNIDVPIGNHNRGQKKGKVAGGSPAGGAPVEEKEYLKKFTEFFYERWQPPAGIFVTYETAVLIEVVWDSRGKVLSKRIIQVSPNNAVTQSVRAMLDNLDYVPTPPPGIATTAKFRLISQ